MTQTYSPSLHSPLEEQLRKLYDQRLLIDNLIESLEAYGREVCSMDGFRQYAGSDTPAPAPRLA